MELKEPLPPALEKLLEKMGKRSYSRPRDTWPRRRTRIPGDSIRDRYDKVIGVMHTGLDIGIMLSPVLKYAGSLTIQ